MFEQFVAIDWSGAASPKKTWAVSFAHCRDHICAPEPLQEKLSRTDVFNWISKQIQSSAKTLIGIDCNLGYHKSVATQQLGDQVNYWQLWCSIEEICAADSNFFAGRWWNDEQFGKHFWKAGKQPAWFNLQTLRRATEHSAVAQGLGNPESPFKLIGAKQVGKGGLAGMRVMHALKTEFGDKVAIWPFESHLLNSATVVISENFPRLFIRHAGFGNNKIRSCKDLNQILAHFDSPLMEMEDPLNDHLTDAIVACAGMRWFYNNKQPLDVSQLPEQATRIEGWIYGVKPIIKAWCRLEE